MFDAPRPCAYPVCGVVSEGRLNLFAQSGLMSEGLGVGNKSHVND